MRAFHPMVGKDVRTAKRMVSDEDCVFGIACYRGGLNKEGDEWEAVLAGNTAPDKAMRWLREGDDSLLDLRADEDGHILRRVE